MPELVKAFEQLNPEKFPELMAYLNHPVGRRVRTNHYVERTNRLFRFLKKVPYKWRRGRTLVRFVVTKLDDVWRKWAAAETERAKVPNLWRKVKSPANESQRLRQIAQYRDGDQ